MRTREEQIADIVSCLRFDNTGFAAQTLTHIAEKFIEEAEERAKAAAVSSIDTQVLTAAREMMEEQKKLPEWVWLNPDTGAMSLGRWARISGNYAPYIRADLVLEAERRAEQRVRAEIGRDSERLDWLAAQFKTTSVYMSGDALYAPSRLLYGLKGRGFRDAIDAAREVG